MRLRSLLTVLCAAIGAAAPAGAQFSLWAPQSLDSGAYIDLFASGESEEFGPEVRRVGWDDRYMREKLEVYSFGFVYHPRFLLYHVSLGAGLDQERYSTNLGGAGNVPYSNKGAGLEYDARIVLLPEHAYNMQLFAMRQEPLFRERSTTNHNTVETQYGGEFRYRKEPWAFGSRYSDDTIASDNVTSNVRRWNTNGEYHRDLARRGELSASAAVEPSRFSTDLGLSGRGELGRLASVLDYAHSERTRSTLRSRLDYDSNDQTDPLAGQLQTSQLTWEELLDVQLPYHFRADGVWRYRDDSNRSEQGLGALSDLESTRRELEAGLEHHLFQSLETRYRFRDYNSYTNFGDSNTVGNEVGINYIKRVPAQGFLLLDALVGRNDTETTGQLAVAEERHPAVQVPGRFLLNNANAEPGTVTILVRSPIAPFEIVRLDENVHYTLAVVGNRVEVTVVSLPPRFVVPGTYDFIASYLTSGGFTLRTDNVSASVELHLWNERVYPYYHYSEVKSDVIEGVFTGQALDSTANVIGLELREGAVLLRVERQDVQWDVGPYTAWLAEFEVFGTFRVDTTVHFNLSHLERYYQEGTATHGPYDEFFQDASGSVQQRLFDRRMTLSIGGSYSSLIGLSETQAWSVNGSLGWRIGLLDIAAGADVGRSRTHGGLGLPTSRSSDSFWVRVRRELF